MTYKNRVEKQREANRLVEERRKAKKSGAATDGKPWIVTPVGPTGLEVSGFHEDQRWRSKKSLEKMKEEAEKKEPIK